MKQILKENRSFLIPWSVIVIFMIFFMGMGYSRTEIHLMLNEYRTPYLDSFFRLFTNIGGNLPWVVCAIMLIAKMWKGAMLTLAQIIATIIVQPIKHIMHHPRPLTVFKDANIDLPIVDGVHMHAWNSFPSGHTAAAFALMFGIAILLPKWWQKTLCLVIAIMAGYSRIYLSQHFIDDVVAGSIIGVVSVLIAMIFFSKKTYNGNKTQETK
ncbi:MAG: phosphatase PAP2 family protein [Paludibacteraceae bacterium]|nr:phosphatase PAP2 family protein [Paludibacteraceae bacterium]